jgi:hypothetical protein
VDLGGGLSGGSGVFLVRRREDAEGDRYSGFKIQIGDLSRAAKSNSPRRPSDNLIERKMRKIALASIPWKEVKQEALGLG